MRKQKINSSGFAKRLGAYSHGYKIEMGDTVLIFTTGQIAFDKNGVVVYPGDAAKQAEYIYERLDQILHEAGATLDDVVKTTVYLSDMADFPQVTAVRNKYLKISEPVSTLVEVNRFVKEGCVVEIEVIAAIEK